MLGAAHPICELLKMVAVPSFNVVILTSANLISGNQPTNFVRLMDQKVTELGTISITYYNCSGTQVSAFNGPYQM